MPGFQKHTGRLAIYAADQVDTDRIIPARFLTLVSKLGYGELLFKDVRTPDFPLDQPEAQGASILVVGINFGCGSSREHAVWAIQQAGFQVVIARTDGETSGFSDIFRQNAANCGLLLVELSTADHAVLTEAGQGAEASVDLEEQTVSCNGHVASFEIGSAVKAQLLAGLDLVGTTLLHDSAIRAYEETRMAYVPEPAARS